MLYTKIQPQSFFPSEGEDFSSVFLPYMDMVFIFFNNAKQLEQIGNILLTESPR